MKADSRSWLKNGIYWLLALVAAFVVGFKVGSDWMTEVCLAETRRVVDEVVAECVEGLKKLE